MVSDSGRLSSYKYKRNIAQRYWWCHIFEFIQSRSLEISEHWRRNRFTSWSARKWAHVSLRSLLNLLRCTVFVLYTPAMLLFIGKLNQFSFVWELRGRLKCYQANLWNSYRIPSFKWYFPNGCTIMLIVQEKHTVRAITVQIHMRAAPRRSRTVYVNSCWLDVIYFWSQRYMNNSPFSRLRAFLHVL